MTWGGWNGPIRFGFSLWRPPTAPGHGRPQPPTDSPPKHPNIQVEPGSKVVAPCRCRGTAKWMWFADMNRRRRRDPVASRTCGTCHAVIDYAAYQKFGCVVWGGFCLFGWFGFVGGRKEGGGRDGVCCTDSIACAFKITNVSPSTPPTPNYQPHSSVVCKAVSWPLDHPGVARLAIGAGVVTAVRT